MRPLLLFGGTFDPPHCRHVELAREAAAVIDADAILIIPVHVNPQRGAAPPIAAAERLELARLAFRSVPGALVSTLELDRQGPSYTIDTLRALRRAGERRPIRFLIGSDQAIGFRTWREPDAILQEATPLVALRPPHTRASLEAELRAACGDTEAARWMTWLLPLPAIDLSSTEARRRIAAGEPTTDLLPPEVAAHIQELGLYRNR